MGALNLVPNDHYMGHENGQREMVVELNLHALTVIQDLCGNAEVGWIEFGLTSEVREALLAMSRLDVVRLAQMGQSLVGIRPCVASLVKVNTVDWAGRGLLRGLAEGQARLGGGAEG